MTANDVILVASALQRDRAKLAPQMSEDSFANYYCSSVFYRSDNLSSEELLEGIVDGGKDCGIDAIHVFVNNLNLRDDTPLYNFGRHARIHLKLLQVKNSAGFSEAAIDKLLINLPQLLDFGREEVALAKVANPKLLEVTRRFLSVYQALDMPELQISVIFASTKAIQAPHENVVSKAALLQEGIVAIFGAAKSSVEFFDADKILRLALALPQSHKKLALAENPISTNRSGGYVALVSLAEYADFITAPTGELDIALFEANVRDYEGETAVNTSIQESVAREEDDVDFWWLNNGITIVADRVQLANKVLELESPQIVNGLQTSTEIYKAGSLGGQSDRGVLVKVIQVSETDTRDRIIRATNSQTSFGPSALKATDYTQRRIEKFLSDHGFFYERRRRQYQNMNKPLDRIISIDQMGQAVISTMVQSPHVARGSMTMVYDNDVYPLLFHPDHPLEMYLASLRLVRACRSFLGQHKDLTPHIDDFQFHLSAVAAIVFTRRDKPGARDLAELALFEPTNDDLLPLLPLIQNGYKRSARSLVRLDQLAKSPEVADRVIVAARQYMRASRRPE